MVWVAQRVLMALVLVWIVTTIVFMAIHMVPGDPAETLLSQGGMAPDPAMVDELRDQLGLNQPILVQHGHALRGLMAFDLGRSMMDGSQVATLISQRLGRTLELIGAAALIAVTIGIPAGTWAAMHRHGLFDRLAVALAGIGLATPLFVIGTLLVMVFAQNLRWMPAGGFVPLARDPVQHLVLLSMPAVTVAIGLAAIVFRITRASILDVMQQDYVRTARAKGVAPAAVLGHHIVRNAMMPVVTVLALHLGTLLGGTVLVESVFNWPGLSGLLVEAVNARDYPVVTGIVLTVSILFITLNLLVELLYGILDPRIRQV